ncbi:MAG: hypothetical protein DRP65_06270 [Planctomycetota bacterium]|nr:MAG: hypothetical protein DRP65_06270 [Planctomycetota bacterium]
MRKATLTTTLLACILLLPGCGKKAGSGPQKVDESKPIAEIKAKAAKMDVEQLRAVAKKYKYALTARQAEVKKLPESFAKIPLTEKLGKEAQALTADIDNLMKSVNALSERFGVYYDQIKAKGGELKDLEL